MLTSNPLKECKVTSAYGMRKHPITKERNFHNGIDLAGAIGTPVYSVADGKILISTFHKNLGYYLVVDHDGFLSVYAHLKQKGLPVGRAVTSGQEIGKVGSTGSSSGPHLHFEIRLGEYGNDKTFWQMIDGKYPNSVDPRPYLITMPEYEKILRNTVSNVDGWLDFIERNKSDKMGQYLPELIVKLANSQKI